MLPAAGRRLLTLASTHSAAESLCGTAFLRQLSATATTGPAKPEFNLNKQLAALKHGQLPVSLDVPASLAPGSPGAAAQGEQAKASWVPKWLSFLTPGAKKDSDAKPKNMDWDELEKVATNFEVDVYRQLCYNARTSQAPPKPRWHKKPLNSRIQGRYNLDITRVSYLRTAQHERITSNMTNSQKAAVKADSNAVLADREMLQDIATTTGFSAAEVADCLRMFNRMRARVQYLYRWKLMGRKMPDSREEIDGVVAQLRAVEEKELRMGVVAKRDRANCPLEGKTALLGKKLVCPTTLVPYYECCGKRT